MTNWVSDLFNLNSTGGGIDQFSEVGKFGDSSVLMESMILHDIQAGKNIAVVDPHGDMVDNVLGNIRARRLEDVIVLDLLEKDCPLCLNFLEWETTENRISSSMTL